MQTNQYLLSRLSSVISKTPFRLIAFIIFLAGFGFLFSPLIAFANYSAPTWWNGDQCDSTHYTAGNGHTPVLQATWSGVQSCGYGPLQSPYNWSDVSVTLPGASAADYEWECTELVKRYLFLAYGSIALGSTSGDQVVAHYANTYSTMFTAIDNTNGNPNHVWPKVGDVLSYSDVHTAIITGVNVTDQTNGNATLNLLEQNASQSGTTTQQFVAWKIKGDIDDPNDAGSDTVTGWLTTSAAHLTWTNEGNLLYTQYQDSSPLPSVLLPDGKVLIAGGYLAASATNHTNIYTDGSGGTGSWSLKANMNTDRKYFNLQLVTVSGGGTRVLAAGGASDGCSCIRNTAELYNESNDTWTTTPNMNQARWGYASSVLSDGKVLVTGGDSDTAGNNKLASTEIYDPIANTWTTKASMSAGRTSHQQVTFTDSNGNSKVMVIGGTSSSATRLATTEIYDPSTDTWSSGQSLTYARTSFSAVLLHDGRILVVGGEATNTHSEVYNPATNAWTTYTIPYSDIWQAVLLGSGANYRVLVVGTAYSGSNHAMFFDPTANAWTTTTNTNKPRLAFSATTLSNGNVIVVGGVNNTGNLKSSEEYTP